MYKNQVSYENDIELIKKMLIDGYYQDINLTSKDPNLKQILDSIKYWSNTITSKDAQINELSKLNNSKKEKKLFFNHKKIGIK